MTSSLIHYEVQGPAAIITLNRPAQRNALSRALIAALTEAFRRAADDPAARCVILTGAGRTFCAGMDLEELAEGFADKHQAESVWEDALRLATLFDIIYTLPKPTIAAANGAAVAGGAGLVTVCDLAVAADHARFGYPEVRRGLVAAMVMPHLLRHVGERMARFLLLTGELIDARDACRVGLINEAVSGTEVLDRAKRWAHWLAEGGPQALAQTKSLLRQFSRQVLSLEEAAKASAVPRLTRECQQGLEAFFAKQPPPWASSQ
jgi:methylglutaconyl-CoA hydratase